MIIFGTRGIKSTIKEGSFHCPQCNDSRDYRHRKVNSFFHIYWIPLIPLGSDGDYVECRTCKGTFYPRVLEESNDRAELDAIYETAIKHSMVLIMLADGEIDQREKETVVDIVNKFTTKGFTMQQLDEYIPTVNANEDVNMYLKKIAPLVNGHGKELIIKCAFSVAAADGNIDDTELLEIQKMAHTLQMPAQQLRGIMNELFQGPENLN